MERPISTIYLLLVSGNELGFYYLKHRKMERNNAFLMDRFQFTQISNHKQIIELNVWFNFFQKQILTYVQVLWDLN